MSYRTVLVTLTAVLLIVGTVAAGWDVRTDPRPNVQPLGGSHDPIRDAGFVPRGTGPRLVLDEPMGVVYRAGEGYYDYQHNGTSGKMIGVDELGFVHLVWMKGMTDVPAAGRHVFHNIWDPSLRAFAFADGQQVNTSSRAGYTCLTLTPSGWCFPAFHEIHGDTEPHAVAAQDFLPGVAAFTTTGPAWLYQGGVAQPFIWPKVAVGPDSVIHMVSTESPIGGDATTPQRMYYSRGHPTWDAEGYGIQIEWESFGSSGYMFIDTVMVIASNIAASKTSDRVVITWADSRDDLTDQDARTQWNNDLYIMISEDGGLNWQPRVNITDFVPPDADCPSQDTLVCDRDTFRVYCDTEPIFDDQDYIHVGFTTRTYFGLGGYGLEGPFTWKNQSTVWHWGEQYEEFTPIMNDYDFYYLPDSSGITEVGAFQLNAHRPSFAVDWTTGYLYCSIWHYENQWSDQLYRMGDAHVSASANRGRTWGHPINVTRTDGGQGTPSPGSRSERDITLADRVTYAEGRGYLHLFWQLDYDAGAGIRDDPAEGLITLNPWYYQAVPVDSVPLRPLTNPFWPALRVDSLGFPGRIVPLDTTDAVDERFGSLPVAFRLYQNYPNPFNPVTHIQFDLVRDARVTLQVFNVLGQSVATLYDRALLGAGAHVTSFDGSNLPSGIYMYRLETDGYSVTQKMILMK